MISILGGLIAAILFFGAQPALAQSCPAPIANVAQQLETYRASGQIERYRYLSCLHENHRMSSDIALHRNLIDFAKRARDISIADGNDQYVIDEAGTVVDRGYFQIALASPITSATLVESYASFRGQGNRFDLLRHLAKRVRFILQPEPLWELSDFLVKAELISLDRHDQDYVLELIAEINGDVAAQLLNIDPYFEGVYAIEMRDGGRAQLLVVNSRLSPTGVVAAVIRSMSMVLYSFTRVHAAHHLASFSGVSPDYEALPARITFRVDRASGTITGTIDDLLYGKQLDFQGAKLHFVPPRTSAPCSREQLFGPYSGSYGTLRGELNVGALEGRRVGGGFRATSLGPMIFSSGDYDEVLGRLTLVERSEAMLLVLRLSATRDAEGICNLEGRSFSLRNGATQILKFRRSKAETIESYPENELVGGGS